MTKSTTYYLLFFTLFFFSLQASAQFKPKVDPAKTTLKFNTLMQLLNYYYVEDIDQPKLTDEAIVAVLKELDPHSVTFRKMK